ncbi:MAG: hypothetical protein RhofKO_33730 [Rhodothermales bacterium]
MRILLMLLMLALGVGEVQAQDHGFRFVRVSYEDEGGSGFGRFGRGNVWAHDYPTADYNFHEAIKRTTNIHIEGDPIVLSLDDDAIFDHTVLYLCEPGYWTLSDEQAERLRAYLERGGFLLFDDFRNMREWINTYEQMQKVFPDNEPVELPPDHPVWSIYYDVDPVAAPSGVSGCWDDCEDTYYGTFAPDGRLVALWCHNQDIGDGWEWPDFNPGDVSTVSFQMGINFLIYALTH